jgi:ABC-type nitrate/sulfonate/bicarbonate transport system substrate-binding protein
MAPDASQCGCLGWAAPSGAVAKRKILQAFVKATMRGARDIVEHPNDAAVSIQSRLKETPIELLNATVSKLNEEKVWGLNGGVDEEIHNSTMNIHLDFKLVSKRVDYKDAFDPDLASQAKSELGEIAGWQ